MDLSEYEAVIEQHVRTAFGLGPDDPLPPPGPVAIATALVRERERVVVEEIERRLPAYREAWTEVVRLAQSADAGREPVEIVWRDPERLRLPGCPCPDPLREVTPRCPHHGHSPDLDLLGP